MHIRFLPLLLLLLTILGSGCAATEVVTEVQPEPLYAIEQDAAGVFVICALPCQELVPAKQVKQVEQAKQALDELTREQIRDELMPKNITPLHLVQFDFDSSVLTQAEVAALTRLTEEMDKGARFILRGYTDDIGPEAYNSKLATERVASVAKVLKQLGWAVASTEALGKCCFVATNETSAGRALNRRVEVFLFNPIRK